VNGPRLTVALALLLVGCGNGSSSSTAGASPISSAAPNLPPDEVDAASVVTDAGACFVRSSSYDRSCAQDSDCVAVPSGGNVCDPCDNAQVACLGCSLSAVSQAAAPAYLAALKAALAVYEDTSLECVTDDSCATAAGDGGSAVSCVGGVCTGPLDGPGSCE
jgi:hypothetical protein